VNIGTYKMASVLRCKAKTPCYDRYIPCFCSENSLSLSKQGISSKDFEFAASFSINNNQENS
jgi:hypothetical protein